MSDYTITLDDESGTTVEAIRVPARDLLARLVAVYSRRYRFDVSVTHADDPTRRLSAALQDTIWTVRSHVTGWRMPTGAPPVVDPSALFGAARVHVRIAAIHTDHRRRRASLEWALWCARQAVSVPQTIDR